jgi:hypothetical protein
LVSVLALRRLFCLLVLLFSTTLGVFLAQGSGAMPCGQSSRSFIKSPLQTLARVNPT